MIAPLSLLRWRSTQTSLGSPRSRATLRSRSGWLRLAASLALGLACLILTPLGGGLARAQSVAGPPPAGTEERAPLPVPAKGYTITDAGQVTIEHVTGSGPTARRLARLYETAARSVEDALGLDLPPRPHAVIAGGDAEFVRRHKALTGYEPSSDSILAIALPSRDLIVIRESGLHEGGHSGLEATLRHELAHLALGRLEARRGARLPRWLNEGLAEFASGRRLTDEESAALASWVKFGQMPDFGSLREAFPRHGNASARAYTTSMAFVTWIERKAPIPRLVEALGRTKDVDRAFRAVLNLDATEAELDWRMDLHEQQSTLKSLLFSMNTWSFMALLAILAGLRSYYVRHQLSKAMAAEEAKHVDRLRGLWTRTLERMAAEPDAPVFCPECTGAYLERDDAGVGCPACGARPIDEAGVEL